MHCRSFIALMRTACGALMHTACVRAGNCQVRDLMLRLVADEDAKVRVRHTVPGVVCY